MLLYFVCVCVCVFVYVCVCMCVCSGCFLRATVGQLEDRAAWWSTEPTSAPRTRTMITASASVPICWLGVRTTPGMPAVTCVFVCVCTCIFECTCVCVCACTCACFFMSKAGRLPYPPHTPLHSIHTSPPHHPLPLVHQSVTYLK